MATTSALKEALSFPWPTKRARNSRRFVFNAGFDIITDFVPGVDEIQLDARLWTGLTSGADLLFLYASTTSKGTVINFDTGDSLTLPNLFDQTAFADDIILF